MNDNEDTPNLDPTDDAALGAALGDAIGQRVEAGYLPPPVASIAERAAARTRARNARRTTGTLAASMVLLVGGIVGWNAITDRDEDGADVAAVEQVGDPVVATPNSDPATSELVEPGPPADVELETVTPADLSTGPLLDWVEVEVGVADIGRLESLPDGRILAHSFGADGNRLWVTDNGVDWVPVPTPPGIFPEYVDIAGDRWLVSGSTEDTFGDPQVFISDDEGSSWQQLTTNFSNPEPPVASFLIDRTYLSSAMISGDRVVLVSQTYTEVDIEGLLISKGYIDDDEELIGWGWGSGTVTADVGDPFEPETLELSYDELGLTPAEIQSLEDVDEPDTDTVRIFAGDDTGFDLVQEFAGSGGTSYSSGSGFAVTLFGQEGSTLLTSPDGITWAQRGLDGFFDVVGGGDGTLWSGAFGNGAYELQRSTSGEPFTTVTSLPGIQPNGRLALGMSGLATTVSLVGESMAFESLDEPPLPTGAVQKDGFELRYNEPLGGITLYDLAADEPVYVFGPETLEAETAPEGAREVDGPGSEFGIIFVDPDTGEDLVAFTIEDLSPVLDAESGSGSEASTEPAPPNGGPFGPPEAWVELGVGDGFVLARVEEFEVFDESFDGDVATEEGSSSNGSFTTRAQSQEPRWFIANVG